MVSALRNTPRRVTQHDYAVVALRKGKAETDETLKVAYLAQALDATLQIVKRQDERIAQLERLCAVVPE